MISAMDVLSERGAAAEYLALHPRAWNLGVFVSCAAFSFIAAKLISKTKKKNIMYILFPVSIFIVLAVMQSAAWVSGIFFNFAVSGTISGLMLSITPTVFQAKQLLVTVKRDELTSEEFFENCEEVTVRALHARLVDALSVSADLLKIESGKGGFIEDLDNASLHDAIHAVRGTPEVERAVCYIAVLDGNDGVAALDPGEKRVSRTSIVSLLTNKLPMPPKLTMRAEVRLGMDVYMIGKMPNAADDASSFSVSSVQTYAAATTNSSAKHIALRFLPWNNPGSNHSNDVDDATSFGGMSHGASDKGPVRCGDSVVIECDGKYLTVVRGKWLCWNSTAPRRSGAFTVEIWEKSKDHYLTNKLTHMLSATKLETTPGSSNSTIARIVEKGEHLRSGDYFRLRSVKFPDMEIGVTNVRLENDYFYVGFAKVDDVGGNGWSMPLRLSVKLM